MFACACCGFFTIGEIFEICPVCFWEEDAVMEDDPNSSGGANTISLHEAKKNFILFQAVEKRFRSLVRDPKEDELA